MHEALRSSPSTGEKYQKPKLKRSHERHYYNFTRASIATESAPRHMLHPRSARVGDVTRCAISELRGSSALAAGKNDRRLQVAERAEQSEERRTARRLRETSSERAGSGPTMKSVIYHTFSQKEAKEYDVQQLGAQRAEAFVSAFLRRSMPRLSQQACENQLQRKAVILEYFTRQKRKEKKKKSKGLSARERRDLQLFDIKPEQQRYSLFLPLHELWKQYIRDLCNGLKPDTQPQMIQAKLLKADLHGAIISVTKSKCPSYVGVTGILLQETKHVFKIITKEDRLKVIPKLNCVFAVEIDDFISYIYGSKFQLRSSERSAKKFKGKGTIDL
ncbi:ribonuclease P protein subunit p29 [Erethizon dorsatum]